MMFSLSTASWIALMMLLSLNRSVLAQRQACKIVIQQRVDCGGGSENQCINRGCCYDNDAPSGLSCYFDSENAPSYSLWGQWESCSAGCVQMRSRRCQFPNGNQASGSICNRFGDSTQSRTCPQPCTPGAAPAVNRPAPATTESSASEECKDTISTCPTYKRFCSNLSTLKTICPLTCGACPGSSASVATSTPATITTKTTTMYSTKYPPSQCVDEYPTCNRVLDICNEAKYRLELTKYCRLTCNLCQSTPTITNPSSNCVDATPERCSRFLSFCSQESFQRDCRKTCGACDKVFLPVTLPTRQTLPTFETATAKRIIIDILTTAAPPTLIQSECKDIGPYCTSTFVEIPCDIAEIRSQCRKTCGACRNPSYTNPTPRVAAATTAITPPPFRPIPFVAPSNPPPVSTQCRDKFSNCADLAQYCGKPQYSSNCQLTCNLCGQSSSSIPPPRVVTARTLPPFRPIVYETPSNPPAVQASTRSPDVYKPPIPPTTIAKTVTSSKGNTAITKECQDVPLCKGRVPRSLCFVSVRLNRTCPETCNACKNGVNPYVGLPTPKPITFARVTTTQPITQPAEKKCEDMLNFCKNYSLTNECKNPRLAAFCRKKCELCKD